MSQIQTLIGYFHGGECKNGHKLLSPVYLSMSNAILISAKAGLPPDTPVILDFCDIERR